MKQELIKEVKENLITLKPFYKPNQFEKFFSWKDLETLLNLRPFLNSERFNVSSNNPIYFKPVAQAWLSDINTVPPSLLQKLLDDCLLYVSDCSRVNESVNNICKSIEENTGMCCDAHIYTSIRDNNNASFPIHWDHSNNLIIQLEGISNFKVWNIFKEKNKENRNIPEEEIKIEPIIDVEMSSGDVIFIPAYMYHKVTSLTKRISISFPFAYYDMECQDRTWIKF